MKFLLSVLALNFLCVTCFPWDDCEGDDICQEILTISTTLENQVAYTHQEVVVYGFSDELNTIPVIVHRFRQEGTINGNCEDKITAVAAASIGNRSFEFAIETFN